MRPTTASSSAARSGVGAATPSVNSVARFRPQSAGVDAPSDKSNASSDELIRDLEAKVRKVVEQKRAESDKLRFAVAKKRDDVEKAKLILQDLLKDSGALGLHYDLTDTGADGPQHHHHEGKQNQHNDNEGDGAKKKKEDDDGDRLQPIASISRRPVYSKHTNIRELEAKIECRAKEAHLVQRRTLVLEHIKKRLQNERVEVAQTTNHLKQVFADLTHETHELQKRDISAAEAVSQVQARLVQQRADMAASVRKFKRELALRQKWSREKAKFEKYYNDQLQAATLKAAQVRGHAGEHHGHHDHGGPSHLTTNASHPATTTAASTAPRRTHGSPTSVLKHRRSSNQQGMEEKTREDEVEKRYREAFQRIGVDPHVEAIDPEEIVHICLSHEELRKELDAKHDEAVERIAQLREQISKARSLAREDVPLSKRGTSQKIETKQLEISSVERQLATVVDQYMFVENTVRPIKIGLQQVLQNVSSATVNVDNMAALEKCLVNSCEEMMRLLRGSNASEAAEPAENGSSAISSSIPEDEAVDHAAHDDDDNNVTTHHDGGKSPPRSTRLASLSPAKEATQTATTSGKPSEPPVVVSLESFTSPYNVRIAAKKRDSYFVPGLTRPSSAAKAMEEEDAEENDFDVMDRAMVKRISSVVVCTSAGKKPKDKTTQEGAVGFGLHDQHHSLTHNH